MNKPQLVKNYKLLDKAIDLLKKSNVEYLQIENLIEQLEYEASHLHQQIDEYNSYVMAEEVASVSKGRK